MNRLLASAAALALLVPLAGCKPRPEKLRIEPATLEFRATGDVTILAVSAVDKDGKPAEIGACAFVSDDPEVAEARMDGGVAARGAGATEVRVSCDALSATVPVHVRLPTSIQITPACERDARCEVVTHEPLALRLEGTGASARLRPLVLDGEGKPLEVETRFEAADPEFNPGARKMGIEVSPDGRVQAVAVGRFLAIAHAGTLVAKVAIDVTMPTIDVVQAPSRVWLVPGERRRVDVRPLRRTGHGLQRVEGGRLDWNNSAPNVARVDADGIVEALAVGRADLVVAADSGAFAQIEVVVAAEREPVPAKSTRPVRRTVHAKHRITRGKR